MSIAIDPVIHDRLNRFTRRQRTWIVIRAAAVAVAFWIVSVLAVTVIDALWVIERGPRSLLTLATYGLALALFARLTLTPLRRNTPLNRAALAVEGAKPEMRDRLLSAIELANASADGSLTGSPVFVAAAQRDVAIKINPLDVRELLPLRLLRRPLTIATLLLVAAISLVLFPDLQYGNRFARAIIPGIDLDRVSRTKITIVEPSPAATVVPADELTAIRIETFGYPASHGRLQWESADGRGAVIEMKRLDDGQSVDDDGRTMTQLVANLPVGQQPLTYRILAGDGVTAWHRLEPRQRPRVTGFEFEISPPDYARLPSRTESATDGELQVIKGSSVNLLARFDMPVVDVVFRLVGEDIRLPMVADADGWRVKLRIDGDDRYQILARGAETGFDNSLSPQYRLVALPDMPPRVAWVDSESAAPTTATRGTIPNGARESDTRGEPRRRLVTSRSIVSLGGVADDEMPISQFFQESAVNRGPWQTDSLDSQTVGEEFGSRVELTWPWDITQLVSDDESLKPGDLIRTRVVAVDRAGQRGESEIREYLISDEALSDRRRENLRQWGELARGFDRWSSGVSEQAVSLGLLVTDPSAANLEGAEPSDAGDRNSETLSQQTAALLKRIITMAGQALHDGEAAELEMLARGIARIEYDLVRAESEMASESAEFNQLVPSAIMLRDAARQATAHRLAVTLADDFDRMTRSMKPLVDETSDIRWESFGRYHRVTEQQFREVAALLTAWRSLTPDSTRNHNDKLLRWIDGWLNRLADNSSPDVGETRVRETTRELFKDINGRRRYGMLDGRLPSMQIDSHNRLHDLAGQAYPLIQSAAGSRLNERLLAVGELLGRDAESNLRRPEADRRYVADARLARRVLDILTADDFQPPDERSIEDVLADIAAAYQRLEAGHRWHQSVLELRALADVERWDVDSAAARFDAPMRWERIGRGLVHALTALERAGVEWSIREPLQQAVNSRESSRIHSAITSRRWQQVAAISVADDLDARHSDLLSTGQALVPIMAEARRRLEAYLPNLSEMASETAESLRAAEQAARRDRDHQPKPSVAAESLEELREEIDRRAEELRAALVDEANTQDLMTAEGLSRARDADIAARAIEKRIDEAATATQQALAEAASADDDAVADQALRSAAGPLADAAETLEQIAQHFARSDATERQAGDQAEPPAPPASLANLEQELGLQDELDQRFARSQALADALQADPREMLKKLSRELNRNRQMQDELSQIVARSIVDAQRELDQQARRERELRLDLERHDAGLLAEKRRLEETIRSVIDHTATVQRSMLHTARQAAATLNQKTLPEELVGRAEAARQELDAAAEALQQAARDASSLRSAEQELFADLRQTAESLQDRLGEATDRLTDGEQLIAELRDDPRAGLDGEPRSAEQRDMQNLQRQGRDTLASSVRNLQNRASKAASNADQQVRQAKSQAQQAEKQLAEAQKQLDKEPDSPALQRRRELAAAKLQNEQRRVADATADASRRQAVVDEARERLAEIGRTSLPQLDSQRPAGELAESMLKSGIDDLRKQQAELEQGLVPFAELPQLRTDSQRLETASRVQAEVRSDVARAAENLRRAARHQQRLGDDDQADRLSEIAVAVANVADNEVSRAAETLTDAAAQAAAAADSSAESTAAGERLGEAETAIANQAQALLEQIDQTQQDAESRGDPDSQAENAARQLAQTLDELDRSLTQSRGDDSDPPQPSAEGQPPAGESQSGDAESGETGAAGDQPPGEPTPGDPSSPGQSGQSQPSSPTLASAARRQMQQLAMRRTLPSESPGNDPSQGPAGDEATGESDATAGQPGDGDSQQSGAGSQGADPALFGLGDVSRDGDSDWGRLRQLESEDASVGRRVEISPEYRRQIEAYFRVIAEQAQQP